MARKSLQGLSGIADTIAQSGAKSRERPARSSAPALGALQGSLATSREIDPALIDDWGPGDRLDDFTAVNTEDEADGFDALKASIRDDGQQVPILVRKIGQDGRYEAIYGRRRLRACRELGIKVRANVQELDDKEALLAKGLENLARRNLSFYERARFASAIQEAGHDTQIVRKVMGLSHSGLSHLTKVTDNVPNDIGDLIGAAPKSGRPKWTALADAFAQIKITQIAARDFLVGLPPEMSSDARLDALLKEITRRGARPQEGRTTTPVEGITIRSGKGSIAVSIKKTGENADFAEWLDGHLEDLIRSSYREFTAVKPADEG